MVAASPRQPRSRDQREGGMEMEGGGSRVNRESMVERGLGEDRER
jgi:hypothetical protein